MRERTDLESRLNGIRGLERDLEDATTLIDLGDAEDDEATAQEGEAILRRLVKDAETQQIESLLSGEADANDTFLEVHSAPAAPRARIGRTCSTACTPAGPSVAASRSS